MSDDMESVAEKLRVMTAALQSIHREAHADRDRTAGDVLAIGRRLERINTEARVALIACDALEG